ncbi:MAG TPA: hypothetical protein VGO86_05030, partial [Candidatus Dormibacteraeota bacterium]
AMHSLKRALQLDVRRRLRAHRAAGGRRRDGARWREELGLTREALERRAYRHLERSGWLLDHLSKALAMHQADEVWTAVERHLFGDREGSRSGMPRVGGFWEYRRLCGARVPKTLGQRTHTCPDCGLSGDRDLVSAALAAFTTLDQPGDPNTARVDYHQSRRALGAFGQRLQAAVAGSTVLRPPRGATAARHDLAARSRRASARRNAGHCLAPTPIGSLASPSGSHECNPESHYRQDFWDSA